MSERAKSIEGSRILEARAKAGDKGAQVLLRSLAKIRTSVDAKNEAANKSTKRKSNYLYVVGTDSLLTSNRFCKVGVTNNIRSRLTSLQTGNPEKLKCYLLLKFYVQSDALKLEKAILNKYKELGAVGEWFSCSPVDITKRVKLTCEQFGMAHSVTTDKFFVFSGYIQPESARLAA